MINKYYEIYTRIQINFMTQLKTRQPHSKKNKSFDSSDIIMFNRGKGWNGNYFMINKKIMLIYFLTKLIKRQSIATIRA